MANVIVKDSKIQGRGVFADKDFLKGDIIMKWDVSMSLTESEAKQIPARLKKYLVVIKGKYIFSQSPEKYLNHSCMPNTFERDACDVAKRDIRKGEELTTDYSLDAPPQLKMRCNCKSRSCKGQI